MSNKDKIMAKIESDLNLYASYEDKHKYLANHKYLDKVYEKYPELQKEVNEIMLGNIIDEFGKGADEPLFSVSKQLSNKEILRQLDLKEANEKYFEDFQFKTKSPALTSQLLSLNLITPEDIEEIHFPKYDKIRDVAGVKGLENFKTLVELKNKEFAELNKQKEISRENIRTLRQEFDDRVGHLSSADSETPWLFQALAPRMIIPGLNTAAKLAMQVGAGWTDMFRKEGLEQVENRMMTWDPEYKRFGPGPEIKDEQTKLKNIFKLEDELKDKWEGFDTKYAELEEMLHQSIKREEKLQASGVDEALNYMDIQSLRSLLGENE